MSFFLSLRSKPLDKLKPAKICQHLLPRAPTPSRAKAAHDRDPGSPRKPGSLLITCYYRGMRRRLPLIFFLFLTCLGAFSATAGSVTWTGWISDAKCGAKMTGYCAQSCIKAGEKPVFVTAEKQVVTITNPEMTKGHEGQRVTVNGNLENGSLTITAIESADKH